MDELINTAEAAQRLGISEDWIRKLCAQGRIPGAKKIGRDWLIPVGARIEPTGLGRPLRTLMIPWKEGKKGGKTNPSYRRASHNCRAKRPTLVRMRKGWSKYAPARS